LPGKLHPPATNNCPPLTPVNGADTPNDGLFSVPGRSGSRNQLTGAASERNVEAGNPASFTKLARVKGCQP
jgi:hypothetical protein